MYTDVYCPLCSIQPEIINPIGSEGGVITAPQKFIDDQQHLLVCDKLKVESEISNTVTYDDIFSDDVEVQTQLTLLLHSKYKLRRKLEDNQGRSNIFWHQLNQNFVLCSALQDLQP